MDLLIATHNPAKFERYPQLLPGYPMSSFMVFEGTDKPHADLSEAEKLTADRIIFKDFLTQFPTWLT